jgi:hypothetical protein
MIALPAASRAKQSSFSESGLVIIVFNSAAVFIFIVWPVALVFLFLFYEAHFLLLCSLYSECRAN